MTETANEGQIIDDRYRIVRKIADGGMATVYEAIDVRLDRHVAVKVMHAQLAQGPHREQFVERFHREARSAAAIANPHIVQVYDTGEIDGRNYLVMEYVHGVNLRYEMNQQGPFTVRETLRVVAETLDGLAAAHRAGVVHRDIKPENILLNDRGHVQITDFGLAKAASQATLSTTGMLLGTAAYLAPEMIENNQATPQGDLYSVGIMAWEMLAGEPPFQSDNPVTMVFKHVHEDVPPIITRCPGIEPSVSAFIARLTARLVEDRPADAMEAQRLLRPVIAEMPMEAWQYRRSDDPRRAEATGDGVSPLAPNGLVPPRRDTGMGTKDSNGSEDSAARATDTPPQPPAMSSAATPSEVSSTTVMDNRSTDGAKGADTRTRVLATDPNADRKPRSITSQDAFTQAITASDTSDIQPSSTAEHSRGGRPRSKVPIIIAIIMVVVLAAGAGCGAWWYYLGPGSYWTMPKPTDLTCKTGKDCTIKNVSWSSFRSTLNVAGIPYSVAQEYNDSIDEGNIISTTPSTVGAHISKRNAGNVKITVSKGIRQATIPSDITDTSTEDGKDPLTALEKAGFTNISHNVNNDEYSLTVPKNALLSISPDPGTTMDHNASVTVKLSLGPMPVNMPDVVGRTKDEAQALFDSLQLKASYSEDYSDTVPSGSIISASQAVGTQLHWGDTVDVVVSKGPQTVTLPDVTGKSTSEATSILEALGLQVKVSAPLGDLTHTVRLQSPSAGQQVRVRDANGNKTVITLTVV
ncbi:protein kinase domain-containing protein [Bifidobacterium apri]|uniref:non-specific serine/threonine protein kinase n=1 Tax=Bifidobacterium apri TaxID=1769423 RepID=A0A6A2VAN0_9BIFI|nr:PASTA domain-containing protein [Bifidobacterium apri]KAB8301761.1 serine/threonine protein kinase [Bifidobacterium apri]